ncbi:hypothetical protein MNBD_ALPHA01-20 [hydrothermal vent metagenome]|uniref:Uncharacterized protein n=1 Tax=hydrothermal vent metagenome TaxID=652676 RepID=A0A3B0S6M7_9ZZZZ
MHGLTVDEIKKFKSPEISNLLSKEI